MPDRLRDPCIGMLNDQNGFKMQFIQFPGKECDGIKTGFRFRTASRKGGIVPKAVILCQIPERKPVAEKQDIGFRGGDRLFVLQIQVI